MNRKQFLILIILGLAVGGLGIYLANRQKASFESSSSPGGEQRVIKDFPLNEVTQIRILQGTNEVNLVRGDVWTVKERWDYPANFTEVHNLLTKIWELKPVQEVEVGPSQYGRLELISPAENKGTNSATLVEFKDGKGTRSILLGKKHMKESPGGGMGMGGGFPVGRYVLAPDSKKVWLVSETFANVEPKPEHWINKDFFKVEKVKSVAVTSPNPTNTWSLSRETESGEWKMADLKEGENFDKAKASGLNYALSSPSFNDVVSPEAKPEETGFDKATLAKLETFDGYTYTATLGGTNEENIHLKLDVAATLAKERTPAPDEKPEDKEKLDKEFKDKLAKLEEKLKNEERFEKWTYLVSKYTVDALLKPRTDFLAEKKEEPKPADAAIKPTDPTAPPIPTLPPELTTPPPPK